MLGRKKVLTMTLLLLTSLLLITTPVHAQIIGADAFVDAQWELLLEDYIELSNGIVQSITLTSHYLVTMENMRHADPPYNVVKAYHLHDVDAQGNPVEQWSLAHKFHDFNWEHGNGMAYNPRTNEIVVSLYTHSRPETRGSVKIMDATTLQYVRTINVSQDFNLLGIAYDYENDRYIIQTNHEANYSIMIMDANFQIIEDIGEFGDVNVGRNYQDMILSGDYVINFPLVLGMDVENHIMMFSLSQRALVSATPLDFGFEDTVTWNEPESIVEIEPGVFIASVTVVNNGVRMHRLYQTVVPFYFPPVAVAPIPVETPVEQFVPMVSPELEAEQIVVLSTEMVAVLGGVMALFAMLFGMRLWVVHIQRKRARLIRAARRQRERMIRQQKELLAKEEEEESLQDILEKYLHEGQVVKADIAA